jgi:hypothetical protein
MNKKILTPKEWIKSEYQDNEGKELLLNDLPEKLEEFMNGYSDYVKQMTESESEETEEKEDIKNDKGVEGCCDFSKRRRCDHCKEYYERTEYIRNLNLCEECKKLPMSITRCPSDTSRTHH